MKHMLHVFFATGLLLGVSFPLHANPVAPVVVSGSATFATSGSVLNVTNSANAIIHWNSFSIGAGELTRFVQPSAASAVLNRVTGQDPSSILGALQSNGRVFLLNPNGIVFGAGAQVNVAGLVASTLALSDADFLAGRLRFDSGSVAGSTANHGAITAASGGQVYLVGNSVTNGGLITAPSGEVVLAAGNSVELFHPGTPNLRVEVVAPSNQARNLGEIIATSGRVGIYAGLIRDGGSINADRVVNGPDGRIILKASGNIDLGEARLSAVGGAIEMRSGGQILFTGILVSDSVVIDQGVGAGGAPVIYAPVDISVTAGSGVNAGAITLLSDRLGPSGTTAALKVLSNIVRGHAVQLVVGETVRLHGNLMAIGTTGHSMQVPAPASLRSVVFDLEPGVRRPASP